MKRVSNIHSAEEVDLEWEREVLRDWRWERWRNKIYVGLTCVIAVSVVFWGETGARLLRLLPLP